LLHIERISLTEVGSLAIRKKKGEEGTTNLVDVSFLMFFPLVRFFCVRRVVVKGKVTVGI
jgi:hypothetical protein